MSSPTTAHPAPADGAGRNNGHPADTDRDAATFYQRADALCRCATESCRQHERLAHLVKLGALPAEQRAAQTLVVICDEAVTELAGAYERAAERAHPARDAGWHAANGVWLACREFARRVRTSTRAARGQGERGERERFSELALDYDLEASALLLLKQATEAYRKVRPDAG